MKIQQLSGHEAIASLRSAPQGLSVAEAERRLRQAKAVVFATGMHTEFGKIAHLTQTAGEAVSPLGKELAHLSRLIAVLAVMIGLVFFAIGRMIGVSFWQDFIFLREQFPVAKTRSLSNIWACCA